jgi:hypothetical protein
LAQAVVKQGVNGSIDWDSALERLGVPEMILVRYVALCCLICPDTELPDAKRQEKPGAVVLRMPLALLLYHFLLCRL